MSTPNAIPSGDPAREAIDSLRGYVYQIYQSALAWINLKDDEFLYLEVAEDYAVVAKNALNAVQVKGTASRVTINSPDIITSINSFINLKEKNPNLNVTLRHLTTSIITKEKSPDHRIGETPTLIMWRNLAMTGELFELRRILEKSKLFEKSKKHIAALSDADFRENILKKIHFDCGTLDSQFLARQISSKVSSLVIERGGVHSQAASCTAKILLSLLELSTNKNSDKRYVDRSGLEEFIEEATHITLNRNQFEEHSKLIGKALSASLTACNGLLSTQNIKPSSVSEVPLPKAMANRNESVSQLSKSLERHGICWISGAAGMGKTVAARVLAHKSEGTWGSINLRGQVSEQIALILSQTANSIASFGLQGLIVDDLDCSLGPSVLDNLHYLFYSANRLDILLVVTSANPPTSEFLFESGLQTDITTTITEFTEKDIEEILNKIGITSANWARYTYLVSGGGHPQLAIAFIQSMAASGWNPNELQTLNSLLTDSPAVKEVRKRARERLLKDLPGPSRRLIERLSLKVGGFGRELAIDLGKVVPPIQDTGIILDSLTGTWVGQHGGDRFSLSPLLTDYAAKTLTNDEKEIIQCTIADSLTKGRVFNAIDMNSAIQAALSSKNKAVITKLCMALLSASNDELEILAPHLLTFILFRTDKAAFPSDAVINHMFRGAQLILLNKESNSSSKLDDILSCFSAEEVNLQEKMFAITSLIVYSKLMLQTSKAGLGVNFIDVICKLDQLLQNKNCALPAEELTGIVGFNHESEALIGIMFLNQARQLSKIEDLLIVFEFLNNSSPELRSRLLSPFDRDDFEVDMLVTGAWLSEHKNKTIKSTTHSTMFDRLEKHAVRWKHFDLAVCCRKFQAIILDEYGNDKETALTVLDQGLATYGQTNSELVRAKAKILYRANDHEGSLALSKILIESDVPLSEVEKAFLGREAAISAEKQGDFKTARQYYLYGSDAAHKSKLSDMIAMGVGLLADAALASWHDGDRLTCLQDFVAVLSELNQFAPDETLRNAHCHAVSRHVLLWLDQDATGEERLLKDGEETRISPGCVSNPEPNSEIGKRFILPIEMAWYMLATVENHASIDAGITENLERYLPNGPVLEGQMQLSSAKIHKAMIRLDVKLFTNALKETVSYFAFVQKSDKRTGGLDIKNVTYSTFPLATKQQQEKLKDLTEQFVLLYFAMCIIKENISSIPEALHELNVASGFAIRPVLLDRIKSSGLAYDYQTGFAQLILAHATSLSGYSKVSPTQIFNLALKVLQVAQKTGNYRLFSESLLPWLKKKWGYIWQQQRFLLSHTAIHEVTIEAALNERNLSTNVKVLNLLSTILPTLGINNQEELHQVISSLPRQ